MNIQSITLGLALIAATLPFVISIVIALKPQHKPTSVRDYFLYGRMLQPGDFLKTSVGYSLQVASIYLFIYWVFTYGAVAIFVPAAWALGYVLMLVAVRAGLMDAFLQNREEDRTIHGYLGERSDGKARRVLVVFAAITTIVALGDTQNRPMRDG